MKPTRFRKLLVRCSCKLATRKPVPESYQLSDASSTPPNFTYLRLAPTGEPKSPDFLAKSLLGQGMHGISLPKDSRGYVESSMPWDAVYASSLGFRRVYRTIEISFSSPLRYALVEGLRLHVPIYWLKRIWDWIGQSRYNYSLKVRNDRMEVLAEIVKMKRSKIEDLSFLDSSTRRFHIIDMFTDIYSAKIWGYPDHDKVLGDFEFLVDSLVASGELSQIESSKYEVNPSALKTLSDFHRDEQRHSDQVKISQRVMWLTAVLATAAIFQVLDIWHNW